MKTIKARLQTSIGSLVLVIVAFVVVYFPAQQREREMASFEAQLGVMADALGIAIGIAIEGQSFEGMRLASEYVSNDPESAWVVISTADGSVFAAYPPEAAEHFQSDGSHRPGEISHRSVARTGKDGTPTHYVTIAKSLDPIDSRISRTQLRILAICTGLFLAALAIIRIIANRYSGPIEELSWAATETSRGRLNTRVRVSSNDELGVLATGFNGMVANLQAVASNVHESMAELNEVAVGLDTTASEMLEDLVRQRSASETISNASQHVSKTAIDVDSNTEQLVQLIAESASSLSEMSSATHSVAGNMRSLTDALDGASSSSTEMVAAVTQTTETMETLSEGARSAEELLRRMSVATQHIDESARSCGESSNDVRDEAAQGASVVEGTINSIRQVKGCFSDIERAVELLEEKMDSVGGAVEIISRITDETGLLSLNASIIAAQAGDRGLGFGVVAERIKLLSHQTASSAEEVANLIAEVREEAAKTRTAVLTGGNAVELGVENSLKAGKSLALITDKSTSAANRIRDIVESAGAQARDAKEVEVAMADVGVLAKQTSDATHEQKQAGAHVSKDLELIRELSIETQRETEKQLAQSTHILSAVRRVSDQITEIATASSSQVRQSEDMSEALNTFSRIASDGKRRAEDCRQMVEKLLERAESLQRSIDRFDS